MKILYDVSQFNTITSWARAAKACDGVIVRCGYRGYGRAGTLVTDAKFSQNIQGALAAGIPVSVYFCTQAITVQEAIEEAKYVVSLIKPYKISFPVMIDEEDGDVKNHRGRADKGRLSKALRTAITKAWCQTIEKAGYEAGIYASESWFTGQLNWKELTDFFFWVAKYSTKAPSIPWDAWQYSDKGYAPGINCMHGANRADVSKFKTVGTEPQQAEGRVKIVGPTKEGMKGIQVQGLQTMLKGYGYYSASIDGDFGPKTLASVKAFQKSEGLAVDGIVGEKTWSRLAGLS